MQQRKMTIHKALSELKLIDSKIKKSTDNLSVVALKNKKGIINLVGISEEDFTKQAVSTYKSINDLIENKKKIKSAIVSSNAITKVIIAGKEMTVADAITTKAILVLKKALLERLKAQKSSITAVLNQKNEKIEANLQDLLSKSFGKDNIKTSATDYEYIVKPFEEENKISLVDPLNIGETILSLEKEIADFESDVDAVLSESNAITKITI